jgi:hypothetical protein
MSVRMNLNFVELVHLICMHFQTLNKLMIFSFQDEWTLLNILEATYLTHY